MRPIADVAADLGLSEDDLDLYGRHKAKLTSEALQRLASRPLGDLVLVTGMTPTTAGEGKTTTAIGLTQALRQTGANAAVALREPSMGPVFGIKGGGTGGGNSQVLPADDINLHFTGDLHAVTAANNLLAAAIDNSLFHGNALGLDPRRVTWRRCIDMNDRALRGAVIGMGGTTDGIPREEGFDITPASEVMAILSVASDLDDLHRRLGDVIVGYTSATPIQPVTCRDLQVDGAMTVLLKDAIRPNLVQMGEGGPAFVHGGPFANIALGCNSIAATRAAMACADITVTEAGFGSDLGAEKFFNVVSRIGGFEPQAAVIVATGRAIKRHGGRPARELETEDLEALETGLPNLDAHIDNVQNHGVIPVVAVNRFPSDTQAELDAVLAHCKQRGVRAAVADPYGGGGEACLNLAVQVREALAGDRPSFGRLYDLDTPLKDKIETVARKVYGAGSVSYLRRAELTLRRARRLGQQDWPVCIAKTQYSLSDDPALLGRPAEHEFTVRDVRPSAGAGFVVVISGDIMTMPGLPRSPAATQFDHTAESHTG
ncbi:MAG: formate--tetrahydrofolate ligase [Chloroflexota bacterium]|nr:formate--tetrahydrofolate ligase [Chloroflexota bacterium]